MPDQTLVFEPGEHFATMGARGRVRRWRVDAEGIVHDEHPESAADPDVIERVEESVRAILTDVVADRLVENVVEHVKSHLDEHARIVADRARTAPGLARLVDVNLMPREGSIAAWAAGAHRDATCMRLRPADVTLIFEADDADSRTSTTLAEFRETGRVTNE